LERKRNVQGLIKALQYKKKGDVREAAAQALGELGDVRAVAPLAAALHDQREAVREAAAQALWKIGDARALEVLGAALQDADRDVRRGVGLVLRDIKDAHVVELLLKVLEHGVGPTSDYAVFVLGWVGDARALPVLVAALASEYKGVRYDAVNGLGKLKDARAVEPLIIALLDSEVDVRRDAALALGEIKDARAVEPLLAALQDQHERVRQAAKDALGQLGVPTSVREPPSSPSVEEADTSFLQATPISRHRMKLLWTKVLPAPGRGMSVLDLSGAGISSVGDDYSEEDIQWARQMGTIIDQADAASRIGQFRKAIALYKSALRLAPGSDLILMSMGNTYVNQARETRDLSLVQTGLRYLERAAELSPDHPRIQSNLQAARAFWAPREAVEAPSPALALARLMYDLDGDPDFEQWWNAPGTYQDWLAELLQIGRTRGFLADSHASGFSSGKNVRARELGKILNAHGGMDLMRQVYESVRNELGSVPARELESAWGGIGPWMG
jgi:HEAT repeat protein